MHCIITQRMGWESTFKVTLALLDELRFWYTNLEAFTGYGIQYPVAKYPVDYTDASDSGYSGYSITLGQHIAHGH